MKALLFFAMLVSANIASADSNLLFPQKYLPFYKNQCSQRFGISFCLTAINTSQALLKGEDKKFCIVDTQGMYRTTRSNMIDLINAVLQVDNMNLKDHFISNYHSEERLSDGEFCVDRLFSQAERLSMGIPDPTANCYPQYKACVTISPNGTDYESQVSQVEP